MIPVTLDQIKHLAPNVRSAYQAAFGTADEVFRQFGINDNPLRLAHFMAQVLHETGGFTIVIENMNYRAERIVQVWPSRFKTVAAAAPFAHNPEKLANKVYGGRMGNNQSGDGFKFIGRGLMQITGRDSYAKFGRLLNVDLVGDPDLAFSAESCLQIACEEWKEKGCNTFADEDSIRKVTKAINGGLIGLGSRQDWLTKTKHVWH